MACNKLLFLLLACVSLSQCHAWWCDGHMLTAAVAETNLTAEAKTKMAPLIKLLAADYPKTPDYITSACWADDLKALGDYMNAEWHYVNLPYVKSALWNSLPAVSNTSGVVWAIDECRRILETNTTDLIRARALRFLIHFTGDIHQPLHAATLYNQQQFPNGDEGGNKFKITGANQTELHAFFDSGAGQWQIEIVRPLRPNASEWINNWTQKIITAYPPSAFPTEIKEYFPDQWATETFAHAVDTAYVTKPGEALTPQYIANARKVCQAQIALGGYRLANVLNYVFSKTH